MNGQAIRSIIILTDILLNTAALGIKTRAELKAFRASLVDMENRDPTPEEWAAVNDGLQSELARLRAQRDDAPE